MLSVDVVEEPIVNLVVVVLLGCSVSVALVVRIVDVDDCSEVLGEVDGDDVGLDVGEIVDVGDILEVVE